MPVEIENLTNKPVFLTLTSGGTLRLSPGETSAKLGDVEVKNNPEIDKLQERRVIALHQKKEAEEKSTSSKKKKAEDNTPGSDNPPQQGEQ